MNLKDIIDLAKAGYKPSDIKELIELAPGAETPSAQVEPDAPTAPQTTEPATDERDTQIAELKRQIAEMQAKAVHTATTDTPAPVDPFKALSEAFK